MKKIKNERGQSLVELAISITVILWLLAGAVEFGIAFFQYIQLRDAAQEGALYGSLFPNSEAPIVARVRGASSSPINLTKAPPDDNAVTVTVSTSGSGCVGDGITVTASYDHIIFMPFASLFISSPLKLTASVTDTILNSTC